MSGCSSKAQVDTIVEAGVSSSGDLEPYHRLIALQKEIIRLAEQNERAKRDCVALLDHVTAKGLSQPTAPKTLRQKVNRALGQWPLFPAKPEMVPMVIKEQATC
jgi:hypothetical protein